ncbi:hypothetical protein AgCh_022832 [Apium graveolens]
MIELVSFATLEEAEKVRRVPEAVEFYHSLMRKDSRRDLGGGCRDGMWVTAITRNMIGEIEDGSAHLLVIKSDVEMQRDFIKYLIKELEEAKFTDINNVVAFVKRLDEELSYLVDERAIHKHFQWPEKKADTLPETTFGYCGANKLHDVTNGQAILFWGILNEEYVDLGHVIYQNMLQFLKSRTSGENSHASIVTKLCVSVGVCWPELEQLQMPSAPIDSSKIAMMHEWYGGKAEEKGLGYTYDHFPGSQLADQIYAGGSSPARCVSWRAARG